MTKFFVVKNQNSFMVKVDCDWRIVDEGSYNVIKARLLGLTWDNYLRYLLQNYDVCLCGSGWYRYALFAAEEDAKHLADLLNKRMSELT